MAPDPPNQSDSRAAGVRRQRARGAALYLAVSAIAIATFSRTLTYPFVYDDRHVIEENAVVTAPGGWAKALTSPFWPPERSLDPLYRPVTTLSFKVNHAIGGTGAMGCRVVNLALHAVTAVLAAAFARRLWGRGSAAWVAGVLFATHPIHAEALGLVVGRGELLVGALATWMLVRHTGRDVTRGDPSVRYHLTTSILFLLALGAKEHAVVAWPAIMMIDLWHRQRSQKRGSWRAFVRRVVGSHHLGLMFALAVFLLMRWVVFGDRTTLPADLVNRFANPLLGESMSVQTATPFALLWLVVRQWFVAVPLCPIWSVGGFDPPATFFRGDVLAGAAVALVMLLVVIVAWRRRGRCWLPVGLFALAVLLPCHFVPAANWLYAERWAYLPSIFLAVGCGGLAVWAPRFSIAGSTAAAALLLATAVPYSRCWASHEGVFEAVVQRQPYSYHGLVGLAAVRHRTGRLAESPACVERLTERFPGSERAWYYRILLARELEDWDTVALALRRWGALRPPGPPPDEIARIAEEVRERGR